MKIKIIAIIVMATALLVGIVTFFGSLAEKYEGSESYVEKSVKSIKRVEALKEQRDKSVSEQERDLETW